MDQIFFDASFLGVHAHGGGDVYSLMTIRRIIRENKPQVEFWTASAPKFDAEFKHLSEDKLPDA